MQYITKVDSMTDPKLKEIFELIFKYCIDNGFESFEVQAEKEYGIEVHQFAVYFQREFKSLMHDYNNDDDDDDDDDIPLSPDIYSGIDLPSSSSDVD